MTILSELPQNPEGVDVATPRPGFLDRLSAGWTAETVRTDAWYYSGRVRAQLRDEIYGRLPKEGQDAVFEFNARHHQDEGGVERVLFDQVSKYGADGDWGDLPTSIEAMDAEVNRRRKAELDEAEAILGIDGGGLAGFLGTGGRAMTDQTSLMLLPFGSGGSLARVALSEAVLGALGEAVILPRENKVADELGLEKPDALSRIAMGTFFGGGLGFAMAATGRLLSYGKLRRKAMIDARARAGGGIDFDDAVAVEYERMSGADNQIGRGADVGGVPASLSIADFDFKPGGNAGANTNRIGYVYGRLIERGMTPSQAAGFTANFMAESGVGLNTRAVGDGGNAFGLAQWNGPRRKAYLDFARKRMKDPGDIDTQIDFLFHELETTEASAWARIKASRSADEAARLVSELYERPGVPRLNDRIAYARDIAAQFEKGEVPKWRGAVPPHAGGADGFGAAGSRAVSSGSADLPGVDAEFQSVELNDLPALRGAQGDEAAQASADLRDYVSEIGKDTEWRGVSEIPTARRLTDAEHSVVDGFLEAEVRSKSVLTKAEQAAIDKTYAENGADILAKVIDRGTTPLPAPLVVYRGGQVGQGGEYRSFTMSRETARNFGEPVQYVLPKGTRVYSPRSGISGGEILVREDVLGQLKAGDIQDAARAGAAPRPNALAPTAIVEPEPIDARRMMQDLMDDTPDLSFEAPDGSRLSLREIMDDLEADETAVAVIDACTLGGRHG